MPWDAKSFEQKHNHKLKGAAASKAAAQASAMVRSGVPERVAIATANKTGDRMMRHEGASPKSPAEHMAKRAKQTTQAQTGREFKVSQSTVSRKTRAQGYQRMGKA